MVCFCFESLFPVMWFMGLQGLWIWVTSGFLGSPPQDLQRSAGSGSFCWAWILSSQRLQYHLRNIP